GGPHRLAGHLVELHHPGAAAARRDDDVRPVDEGRLADTPADLRSAEVAQDVAVPDLAAVRIEAPEVPALGQHVQAIAVHGGRAARSVALAVAEAASQALRPQRL